MAVSKQFNNRRQPVLINAIDPEILTEAKLTADGFVKNTDYATGTTGGVVKVANSSGMSITSQGTLQAAVRTMQQYDDGAGTLVIGKGTLENIFQPKSIEVWRNLMLVGAGVFDPDELPVGTVISDLTLTKTADGFVFSATKTEPETP